MSERKIYPCSRCTKALTGYLGGMCDGCRAVIAGRAGEAERVETSPGHNVCSICRGELEPGKWHDHPCE